METFVWIARLGSFRAAAERVYTTQPSVSSRIANLESELGVRLFDRRGRQVSLTAKGRELLDYAERLISLRGDMLQAVANRDAIRGSIRLGVAETIVYTWLPRLIERLNVAYPAVNIELDVDISVHLAEKIMSHELDLAFLMGTVNQPDVANLPLCRYPLSWVASPRLDIPDEPVPLAALSRWPIITYPRLSKPHADIRGMLEQSGERVRIHASSSLATIIRMTVDGIGVSALPTQILEQEIASGNLRVFQVAAPDLSLDFSVSYGINPESQVARAIAELALDSVPR
nr:LysR family transcriptional regulator [Natronocella acetinitrilica]